MESPRRHTSGLVCDPVSREVNVGKRDMLWGVDSIVLRGQGSDPNTKEKVKKSAEHYTVIPLLPDYGCNVTIALISCHHSLLIDTPCCDVGQNKTSSS